MKIVGSMFGSILGIVGIILWILLFRAALLVEQHLGRIADCMERKEANRSHLAARINRPKSHSAGAYWRILSPGNMRK